MANNRRRGVTVLLLTGMLGVMLLSPGAVGAAVTVEQRGDTWRLANDTIELLLERPTGRIAALKSLDPRIAVPVVAGGVTCAVAGTPATGWKKEANGVSFRTDDPGRPVAVTQRITVLPDSLEWQVVVENKSAARQQPAVTLALSFPTPKQWTFWDGQYVHENLLNDFERREAGGFTFPMACVYASDWGLAAGLTPLHLLDPVSGVRKESAGSNLFSYTATPSVPSGGKSSVTFVLYTFRPDYGFRCALQRYYDLYPAVFSPRPGIDPRAERAEGCNGVGGEVYGQPEMEEQALENNRRFFCNWAWTYPNSTLCTPLGNYAGHADKWPVWYPAREQQLKHKAEMYARGKDEVAMCHYVWLPGAESELMEKFYPDAIARDSAGKPQIGFTENLGGSPAGHAVVMYGIQQYFVDGRPNKLGQDTMDDMRSLVKDLNLPGFAFDTCGGMDQAVFEDYVYSLTNPQGYRVGVVGNSPGSYYNAFRMDFCLLEHTPYGDEDNYSWPSRYLLGRKVGVFLWPYKICDVVDDLRSMSAEEIREAYRGLRDYAILNGLRSGNMPAWQCALGVPKMYRYLPVMLDLAHTGWEPAYAMKLQSADGELWLSRYGKGARSFLCIGNPTADDKQTTVLIDNPYLGEYRYLFATYEGVAVDQTIRGSDTIVKTTVPARMPVILKSWLGLKPRGEVTGKVSVTPGLDNFGVAAELVSNQAGATPFVIRVPEDARIASVILNGARMTPRRDRRVTPSPCGVDEQEWTFTGALKQGANRLDVRYASTRFASPEQEITGFPLVKDGQPACTIALSNPADRDEQYLAWMLQNYVRFFYQQTAKQKVLLPIKPLAEAGAGPRVVITIKKGTAAEVRRSGETLAIGGAGGAQAKDTMRKLLRVLDRTYVWIGKFGETYYWEPGYWDKVIVEKGLLGTIID